MGVAQRNLGQAEHVLRLLELQGRGHVILVQLHHALVLAPCQVALGLCTTDQVVTGAGLAQRQLRALSGHPCL